VRAFLDLDIPPLVVESALGDSIVDIDGNSYVDYCMSWGALIHGHSHPDIVKAATERLVKGSSFGATTQIEEKLARQIVTLMPSCEKVRLVSSGTEATMTAVRVARGFTGKKLLIKFAGCYHGHADFFLIQAGSGVTRLAESTSAGIPAELLQSTICLPYNDIEAFEEAIKRPDIRKDLACVIIEPIAANMGLVPASREFLEVIRQQTLELGALLIFDEVISGFRVSLGGAQEHYGIMPDLSCFGKVIGGGYPAAGFGGRGEIMDYLAPLGPVYQAGTLSGNPIAMEAGLKALEMLQQPDFFEKLDKRHALSLMQLASFCKTKTFRLV
jgi:glutamate-1-semialdehyde 2,1-aminomutase